GERRRLRGNHARHHVGASRGRVHRHPLEGPDRGIRARGRAVQLGQPVRAPVPLGRGARTARHGVTQSEAERQMRPLVFHGGLAAYAFYTALGIWGAGEAFLQVRTRAGERDPSYVWMTAGSVVGLVIAFRAVRDR